MDKSVEAVTVERTDAIATVSFSSAKANSLSRSLLTSLSSTIAKVGADESLKVIILRSEGSGAFCAGASFDEMQQLATLDDAHKFFMGFGELMLAIVRCPIPVVAAVHGKAVGGGLGLIAACDYVIASKQANVKLSELSIGIGPYVISAALIRRIGLAKFSELTLALDWRDANWAANAGLFAEVVELPVRAAALLKAQGLASVTRQALTAAKQMLSQGTEGWENELEELAWRSATLLIAQKH